MYIAIGNTNVSTAVYIKPVIIYTFIAVNANSIDD